MSGHTPGPWVAGNGNLIRVNQRGSGTCIAGIHRIGRARNGPDADAVARANARLIAAAPDLLEACIAAQEASGLSDACKDLDAIPKHIMDKAAVLFERARTLRDAAIARATGGVA